MSTELPFVSGRHGPRKQQVRADAPSNEVPDDETSRSRLRLAAFLAAAAGGTFLPVAESVVWALLAGLRLTTGASESAEGVSDRALLQVGVGIASFGGRVRGVTTSSSSERELRSLSTSSGAGRSPPELESSGVRATVGPNGAFLGAEVVGLVRWDWESVGGAPAGKGNVSIATGT